MKKHMFTVRRRKIRLGAHKVRLLILSPLERGEEKVPGVLWIHGGGYQSGSAKDVFVTRALSLVVKFGMVLVAPDYRLSRHHPYPAGLNDCHAALLYLRDHAEELGVRSDQIMVGGESAGGGMTAALCMLARDRKEVNIAFQMPLYPMLDDRDTPSSRDNHARNWNTRRNRKAWKRYLRDAYGTELVPRYAAPARCTDYSGLPPCYTFVGDIEPFYDETMAYVRHLREAGIRAEVDVYPDWWHAYDVLVPTAEKSRQAVARFEEKVAYALAHDFAPQDREPQGTGLQESAVPETQNSADADQQDSASPEPAAHP